ncbi:MAG: tandem-95 repeat protein [Bacteroidales bacterium]|nr:tandem-95 repeat protein [Bacteroidales bacterium]MCF8456322.1 tandem-95 repeat protein [Bacteroidales bacterium]
MKKFIVFGILILAFSVESLAQISEGKSYMLPDIGTPGYATKIEIISKYIPLSLSPEDSLYYTNVAHFYTGITPLFANNSTDAVRVVCTNPDDYSKVTIGPICVSWEGQMISTHIFVHENVNPNSNDWELLDSIFKIPIGVKVLGVTQFIDTFYILQPQPAINSTTPSISIGGGGSAGKRSPRGAMILESFSITGTGQDYVISTLDCDPNLEGNQGYLPITLISLGNITIGSNTILNLDASFKNAAPGGGGGGAGSKQGDGGHGFTSGGYSCTPGPYDSLTVWNQSGESTGKIVNSPQSNYESLRGNYSINGIPGGLGRCDQGGGGGTGHPLGYSGAYGEAYTITENNSDAFPGMFGGGSAGGEINLPPDSLQMPFGGGGGGNGTIGERGEANYNSNGGNITGNNFIVPFGGGSGGGAGNVWSLFPGGSGGGGGGGIALYSHQQTNIGKITANGGDGGDGYVPYPSSVGVKGASGGGGGSGGNIIIGAKINHTGTNTFEVNGGAKGLGDQQDTTISHDGGNGGGGRIRIDGTYQNFNNLSDSFTFGIGPSTQSVNLVNQNFTLTGTGNGSPIWIYIQPQGSNWYFAATTSNYVGSTWSVPLSLDTSQNAYYVVALQENLNNNNSSFIYEPKYILSQAASNVLHINKPPIANNDSIVLMEGDTVAIDVLSNDYDPFGGTLGTSILTNPVNGTAIVLPNNEVQYIPNNLFFGSDTIEVLICDGLSCDTSFIYITVIEHNDPPITQTDFVITGEDTQVTIYPLLNDYDPDPLDVLVLTNITNGPFHGTFLITSDSTIEYTPDPNFYGEDYLIYQVCNSLLYPCATDTVFITVNSINDVPVAFLPGTSTSTDEITTSTFEEEAVTFCFDFFDVDGDVVSISNLILPDPNGTVIGNDSLCITWLPDSNFVGLDTILVIFCDDNSNSLCDTVLLIIDVIPVNDQPVVLAPGTTTSIDEISISTPEDTPVTHCFEFFDIDGDTVSITGWNLPNPNGIVIDTLTDTICITYLPDPNFVGVDTIEVFYCDNNTPSLCDTFLLIIDVLPVNDGPLVFIPGTTTATDVLYTTTPEDSMLTYCFEFFDIEGNNVSISGWNLLVPNGIVVDTLSDTICITYMPYENFFGIDSIEVYFCDDNADPLCDTVLLIIDVTPVNDPPLILDPQTLNQADTIYEIATSSIPQIICIETQDADNDSVFIASIGFLQGLGNGSLTLISPGDTCFLYTSDTLFVGIDSVLVIVSDGTSTDTAIVVITVIPYNHAPMIYDHDGIVSDVLRDTTHEEQALEICLDMFDADGHIVSISQIYSVTGLAVVTDPDTSDNCFTYTPLPGTLGPDTVEVLICDNGTPQACTTIQVIIEVLEVNDAPNIIEVNGETAGDTLYFETPEDIPLLLCFDVEDEENQLLTFSTTSLSITGNGSLYPTPDLSDTCIFYSPNTGFNGVDTLIVYICDNGMPPLCDEILVIVNVIPVNDPPIASDILVKAYLNQSMEIDLTENVYDPDDALAAITFSIQDSSSNGFTENYNGIFEYTPNPDYLGNDTILYRICDDDSLCDEAYIFIIVDYDIYFPNGFSPNGDGINDYFEILGLENFKDAFDNPLPNKFEVYNRWGGLVFSVEGYKNDEPDKRWEGQSNSSLKRTVKGEKLPEGTYYYYFSISNSSVRKSSFIILKY